MWKHHPRVEDFESLFRGASGTLRNTWTMRHLLIYCPTCRETLRAAGWNNGRVARLVDLSEALYQGNKALIVLSPKYDAAFAAAERALQAIFAPEAALEFPIASLLDQLERVQQDEQARLIVTDAIYAHPALVRELIERSHSLRYDDPQKMLHYAQLARLAADACPPHNAGSPERGADLRARGWLQYANSLRVSGQLREADEALEMAKGFRSKGTKDPLLRARILEQAASLRTFQGRFQEAIELAQEATAVYRELDESNAVGSTLVQIAIASLYAGDPEHAVRTLNRAIPVIDPQENPHLLLAACHNLIRAYIDLDCPEKALSLYFDVRDLYRCFGEGTTIVLRTAWQEGQILRDLGHLQAAEVALRHVRQGFLERGLFYEVALVSLDLAAVYVRLGKTEDVRQTATEAVPIFRALNVEREVLGSLLQLQQAAGQEQQALELIRLLNTQLSKHNNSR